MRAHTYQEWDYIITYAKSLKREIEKRNVICILFSIQIRAYTEADRERENRDTNIHFCLHSGHRTCRIHCLCAGIIFSFYYYFLNHSLSLCYPISYHSIYLSVLPIVLLLLLNFLFAIVYGFWPLFYLFKIVMLFHRIIGIYVYTHFVAVAVVCLHCTWNCVALKLYYIYMVV